MSNKLSVCLYTMILDFTIFIVLILVAIMLLYARLLNETKTSFPDTCFSSNTITSTSISKSKKSSTSTSSPSTSTSSSTTGTSSSTITTTKTIPLAIIESAENLAVGNWYPWDMCPTGSFATGFNVKVDNINVDATGLNTIQLICNDSLSTTIDSNDGTEGLWGNAVSCANSQKIIGFKYKYEPYVGRLMTKDDTSANSIYFYCEDNSEIRPTIEGTQGSWSTIKKCATGYAICGIMVQYDPVQGTNDDTGLNNVKFNCCSLT